ncbi:Protein Daple [Frankliniella fusca]|uniref:Protein Daple n=1 Tax=Frankliniella fusca TaxID=407009 RepID=A0AAE1I0I0_9NEOP|nr:Protein Daple [Frankliniella fusca]
MTFNDVVEGLFVDGRCLSLSVAGAILLVGVGQLVAAAVVPGLPAPPPQPPSTTTTPSPTDAPRLASPLAGDDGNLSSSSTPSSAAPRSTKLAVVRSHAAWPLSRTTPTPVVSRLVLTPHPARQPPPHRGSRRYRTADVYRDAAGAGPTTVPSPTTLTSPTTLSAVTMASGSTARPTPLTTTSLVSLGTTRPSTAPPRPHPRDDRGGRAAWDAPTGNTGTLEDASNEQYYRRYYTSDVASSGPGPGAASNTSWWSAVQTGLPILGQGLGGLGHGLGQGLSTALRRVGHHHHVPHRPFVAAHWEDPDYGDSASGGSQVVAVGHPHPHPHAHQPVYYVADQNKKEDSWSDLTTKLIILAVIKLLIVKALSVGAFKLFIIGLVKIPIVFAHFALKFAFVVKFFKFIKEEQALAQLESRVADSRRCLQKMACDVGYRSQAVKGYADWVLWLMGLMKPILGEAKRNQLKGFIAAYKAGLGGRSCYRKYPCYANNMNSKRAKGAAGRRRLEGAAASNRTVEIDDAAGAREVDVDAAAASSSSASVEERIVYDPVNGNSTSIDN